MSSYTWIKSNAFNDGAGVESFHLSIGIELVEVADAQGEVGVGEELDGLGLFHSHKKGRDVFFDGTLFEQVGKDAGSLFEGGGVGEAKDGIVLFGEPGLVDDFGDAGDDARGVEVVVESLGLAEEFGEEEEVETRHALCGIASIETATVADWYG